MNVRKRVLAVLFTPPFVILISIAFLISSIPIIIAYVETNGQLLEQYNFRGIDIAKSGATYGPSLEKEHNALQTITDTYNTLGTEDRLFYSSEYNVHIVDGTDVSIALAMSFIFYTIFGGLFISMAWWQIRNILRVGNMEKQSKRLRKLGVQSFINAVSATLIDSSSRGNLLYISHNIIENQRVKFLVYYDSSTDRQYIKYVPDHFTKADEAQAWSLSLTLGQYKSMTIEA